MRFQLRVLGAPAWLMLLLARHGPEGLVRHATERFPGWDLRLRSNHKGTMLALVAGVVVAIGMWGVASAQDDDARGAFKSHDGRPCREKTLRGSYLFAASGFNIVGGVAQPKALHEMKENIHHADPIPSPPDRRSSRWSLRSMKSSPAWLKLSSIRGVVDGHPSCQQPVPGAGRMERALI